MYFLGCTPHEVDVEGTVQIACNGIRAWIEIAAAVTREPAIVEIEITA